MFVLHLKMLTLVGVLFAIVYAVVVMVGTSMGMGSFYFYLIIALGMMFIQYLIGPKVVEWQMRLRYSTRGDSPQLFAIVEGLARKAGIPAPRICISDLDLPNAFAFGRSVRDGRVCVTAGLLRLLNEEELKAVVGHEISHLKNRDVAIITLLSCIPIVLYHLAWSLLYMDRRRDSRGNNSALLGIAALLFYSVTSLLVRYASRIREYFADRGAIMLGNQPSSLASALYKLVYGCARLDRDEIKATEGLKAFFVNDPSRALTDDRHGRASVAASEEYPSGRRRKIDGTLEHPS